MTVAYEAISKRAYDLGTEHGEAIVVTWILTSADFEGDPFIAPTFTDITVHAYGTDWNGKLLNFRGTNEVAASPSNYANLTDPTQTVIALTVPGIKTVLENAYQYSPLLSGAPTNDVTVIAIFTKRGR